MGRVWEKLLSGRTVTVVPHVGSSSKQRSFSSIFLTETIIGQISNHKEETPTILARCRFWQFFFGSNNKIVFGKKSFCRRGPYNQEDNRVELLKQHSWRRLPGMFCEICLLHWKKRHGIQLQVTVIDTSMIAHQNMWVKQDPLTRKFSAALLTFVEGLFMEDNYLSMESFTNVEKKCYSSNRMETWQIPEPFREH